MSNRPDGTDTDADFGHRSVEETDYFHTLGARVLDAHN